MKIVYLLACLLVGVLLTENSYAQSKIEFGYDDNGNRDSRKVIVLNTKSATIPPDSLLAKKDIIPLNDKVGLQRTMIYPNPTKGMLRIDFPDLGDQLPIIRAYDQSGRLIVQKTALSLGNEIDLTAYPPGFYMMVIQIGQEKKDWKIIKE